MNDTEFKYSYEPTIDLARRMSIGQAPSRVVTVKLMSGTERRSEHDGAECSKADYFGSGYSVLLTKFDRPVIRLGDVDAIIQVANDDGSAHHDWRELQKIKNQLVGEDWLAVEVYPPERFVKDPSNAFYLWCWKPKRMHVGWNTGRVVLTERECIAPQRPFPSEAKGASHAR